MNHRESSKLTRRAALRGIGHGFGLLALGGLAAGGPRARRSRPSGARAKRVIFLCMAGGPSHLDTFDHKPALARDHGKTATDGGRRGGTLLASPWKFQPHGESGLHISELFPAVARHADRLCLLRGMHTTTTMGFKQMSEKRSAGCQQACKKAPWEPLGQFQRIVTVTKKLEK